jgi:hypothetical protein
VNSEAALTELETRWRTIFAALAGGGEVPPTLRLRTEGMMETLSLLHIAEAQTQTQMMLKCYNDAFEQDLVATWGVHWQDLFPFPQIPGFGQRAPVYPSTK